MSGENKWLDKEISENLQENMVIPRRTEEIIQDAYDEVRILCRERRKKEMKKNMNMDNRQAAPFKKKKKGFMAAIIAAAVLATSSLCVFAAMHYFDKNLEIEEDTATYSFEVNYDLKPVKVTAEPGYLPDGMVADGGGKYYPEDDYGKGISIIPINTLNMEEMRREMSFEQVERVEKTTIQDMEAHIILFKEEQKYRSGKDIFLFNPQEGYVLWLYGDYNISLEELKKVAENLEISVEPGDVGISDIMKENEQLTDMTIEEVYSNGIRKENITAVGEELDCEYAGCGFTVLKTEVFDSVSDIEGYSADGVNSPKMLQAWLNEDGTHKPYQRIHYDENGKILTEEQVTPKFLAVTVKARQYGASVWESTPLDARLVRMVNKEDGVLGWASDTYAPVPDQEYELQLDMRCFYMGLSDKNHDAKDFFYKALKEGDNLEYTMIFAVDSDMLTDENTVLVLNFNATGGDTSNPQYSAITK